MKVKLFYRTQRDLATALNELVDSYHEEIIDEQMLIQSIETMYENNPNKLIKNNDFTTVVQQQCGKRRLEIVGKILSVQPVK